MRADSPDDIDRVSFHLPLSKEMGDQVHMEITPLRSYEGFATELNKKLTGDETTFEELPTVPKAGLFYWITFNIEYPGKTGDPVESYIVPSVVNTLAFFAVQGQDSQSCQTHLILGGLHESSPRAVAGR